MAKYSLGVRRDFVARHYLVGGDFGAEGELHSHRYRAEIVLEGDELDGHGFLVDIVRVERELEKRIERYRDRTLNDLPELAGQNPGIEVLARVTAEALSREIPWNGIEALTVKIWESDEAWASYRIET